MKPMVYPDVESTASDQSTAAWLQQSVGEYFVAMVWEATMVPPIARQPTRQRSLDMTVVQYFASFPWADGAPTIRSEATPTTVPTVEDLDRSLAELLAFEPTVDSNGVWDISSHADSGSLADFSDFF